MYESPMTQELSTLILILHTHTHTHIHTSGLSSLLLLDLVHIVYHSPC